MWQASVQRWDEQLVLQGRVVAVGLQGSGKGQARPAPPHPQPRENQGKKLPSAQVNWTLEPVSGMSGLLASAQPEEPGGWKETL